MSFMRPLLNFWLRWTEKTHLVRAKTPEKIRRAFELKARLFFHAPKGTQWEKERLGGVASLWVSQGKADKSHSPLILYFHGGAYVFGSPKTHGAMLANLAKRAGLNAVLPDYRKAPENQFPAALEDALAVYRALLDQGYKGQNIVLGGDSAGGGLALSLLAELHRLELPAPLGCFAFSPLTDIGYGGQSMLTNAASEVVLPSSRMSELRRMVIGDANPKDPKISPLFARFSQETPVFLMAGTTEILLDDTRRMTIALRDQGVAVKEVIEFDLPHVWPIFHNFLPEARGTLDQVADWIKALSPRQDES